MSSPSHWYRTGIATASAISGVVAWYLHWVKMNPQEVAVDAFGSCNVSGGCALVQNSAWGWFLGYDVALIGTVGYAAILLVSLAGLTARGREATWPTFALLALIYPAVLFTIRLKHAEFVILRTFCPWCAVSAVAITLCAILVTLDWRQRRRIEAQADEDGALPAESFS
jgi:uncharacterized membrane protein